MKWLRDHESRVPHAYARAAHVSRCGKALRVEAREREVRSKIGRCALCARWMRCDEAREVMK